jgi:hypothetical protein
VQFTTNLTGDGSTKDFYLKVKPVDATYLTVYVNNAAQANPTNFTVEENIGMIHFNSNSTTKTGSGGGAGTSSFTINSTSGIVVGMSASGTGIASTAMVTSVTGTNTVNVSVVNTNTVSGTVTFTQVPKSGATIVVSGTHYRYFTTSELTTFVNTAVTQHTDNKTDSYGRQITLALIPVVEEYPVALLATIEALWALATDSAFDINISAPDGVTIPRSQRFSQLSAIIQTRKEQYRELCAALNIGLWRIEMGVLRRVSRTTNKLVPVYMPQEIDDSTKPERVYIENNLKGRTPLPDPVGVYDIVITQGDTWEVEFDIYTSAGVAFDLTGYNLLAQIRTYPGSPLLVATPTITVVDMVNGKIKLSLTSDQTDSFPLKSFWDLQISSVDGTFNQTYVRGLVFANPQVTVDNPTPVVYQPYQGPTFTADNPPKTATVGTPYSYTFLANGTNPTYVVSSGSLPTGLKLSKDGTGVDAGHTRGSIYGTPTVAGTFVFAVTCTSSYVAGTQTLYQSTSTPNFSITVT